MKSLVEFINEGATADFEQQLEKNILALDGFDKSSNCLANVKAKKDLYFIQLTSKSKNVRWISPIVFTDEKEEWDRGPSGYGHYNKILDTKFTNYEYSIENYKELENSKTGFGFGFNMTNPSKWADAPIFFTGRKDYGLGIVVATKENADLIKDNIKTLVK